MRKLNTVLVLSLLVVGISCSDSATKTTKTQSKTEVSQEGKSTLASRQLQVDMSKSQMIWKGHKIMGSHEGEFDLKSGFITASDSDIKGGEFVVDMMSIRTKSLMDGGDQHDKDELAAHLRDGDFFDANSFPTATFKIKKSQRVGQQFKITGDMTIKGVTQSITFLASWTNNMLKANVNIDRTKFNIKYGSGTFFDNLGDRAIKDEFSLDLSLVFKQ